MAKIPKNPDVRKMLPGEGLNGPFMDLKCYNYCFNFAVD